MSDVEQQLERIIEFLYAVPVGLLEFDGDGQIIMANPTITQIFNPFTGGMLVANLFDILRPQLPDLVKRIMAFEPPAGMICDHERYRLLAPTSLDGRSPPEALYVDLTVKKQQENRFYAVVSNMTSHVSTQNQPQT